MKRIAVVFFVVWCFGWVYAAGLAFGQKTRFGGSVMAVEAEGNLTVSAGAGGFTLIDQSDPARPVVQGARALPSWVFDTAYVGGYLYVASSEGLYRYDISTPSAPRYDTMLSGGMWRSVTVFNNHLYAIGGTVCRIYDITNPASERFVTSIGVGLTMGYDVAVWGRFEYVTTTFGGGYIVYKQYAALTDVGGKILIYDVTDPSAPTYKTSYTQSGAFFYGAVADGNELYAIKNEDIVVLNVADLNATPSLLATITVGESIFRLEKEGDLLYVGAGDNTVKVYNVATPSSPTYVGSWNAGWDSVRDVAVRNGRVYAAANSAGIRVGDASDPSAIVTLSPSDTYSPLVTGVAVGSDGMIYAIDTHSRLYLFDSASLPTLTPYNTFTLPLPGDDMAFANGYAYIIRGGQLMSVDLTDKRMPSLQANLATGWGVLRRVRIAGDMLFAASESGGIGVADISDPTSLHLRGTCATTGKVYDVALKEASGYILAFVAVENVGVEMIDIRPSGTGVTCTGAGSYGVSDSNVTAVAYDKDYVYMGRADGRIDIATFDTTSLRLHVQKNLPSSSDKVTDILPYGDKLLVAGVKQGCTSDCGRIDMVDISDPSTASIETTYHTVTFDNLKIAVSDGIVYAADQIGGMTAINIGYKAPQGTAAIVPIINYLLH